MTPFAELPVYVIALSEIWAYLIIAFGSANAVYAVFLKKHVCFLGGAVTFLLGFFIWQTAFDFHSMRLGSADGISSVTEKSVQLPWLVWLCALTLLTLTATELFRRSRRYRRQSVSPMAVKLCADRMPGGICYWRESGRVVLSNLCMDRLCIALTGQPLLNGGTFRDALTGDVVVEDGRAWRFTCRKMQLDHEPIYEMIASDITEEYRKTRALERDAEALSRIKQELQTYQTGILESVRRQEILQAKINIHDEMNRLMLSTMAAGSEKASELDAVLSLWEQNALLLCMEAENGENEIEKTEQIAELLNVRLIRRGSLPAALTDSQRELFFSAAQEAIVNAVKHGEAASLTVSFSETDTQICCHFENGGKVQKGTVQFTGGLANLDLLARKQGAKITAEAADTFRLTLIFSKNS